MGEMGKSMEEITEKHAREWIATPPKIREGYRKADCDAILDEQGSVSGTDGKHVNLHPILPPWENK